MLSMSSSQTQLRIRLSKTVNDILIEVWISNEEEFREGYSLLNKLCSRAMRESKMDTAFQRVSHLWTMKNEKWQLSDIVIDKSHRVSLSVLKAGWLGISEVDVIDETGMARSTVRDQLTGATKSVSEYYESQNGKYRLTDKGLDWILETVIPQLPINR
jgi:hypothetical protein